MRLVALELNGFKSFADPQKLMFPGGMTAVVGPNGCGKSNITDALAWVLGEQRASLLRGAEMSDVIFSGTSDRRATGMAEVKLSLEMADPALPGATKEIVISRRLYRDQGSEYRVNGRETRLKDVQDLLMDTGMGTRAYSFIQQGQIDLILSTKPKDRRLLLEEAAGITRFKLRRTEAERRLVETKANLERLQDILFELNKQLDSLRRQAVKAKRAAELDQTIKATQRVLLSAKTEEFQLLKSRLAEARDQLERQVSQLTVQVSEKAAEVGAQRLAVDEIQRSLDRGQRAVMALDQRLQFIEQEKGFEESRVAESTGLIERMGSRRQELVQRVTALAAEIAAVQEKEAEAALALAGRETAFSEVEESVVLAGGALRRAEAFLRDLRHQRSEAKAAVQAHHKQKMEVQSQIAQLEGRLESLNHEEAIRAPRLEGLESESIRLGKELEGSTERLEAVEEALRVRRGEARDRQEALRTAAKSLQELEGRLEAAERRSSHISDLLQQASGSAEIKKGLAWLRERGVRIRSLAECIEVDETHRPDLERLLDSWLQAIALDQATMVGTAEAPGQLWMEEAAPSEPLPAPDGCAALRAGVAWKTGAPRMFEALVHRAFRCADADLPGLAFQHPELAFVSPRFTKLPFGPVQLGAAAPAASPLKLQSELERTRRDREDLLTETEAAEEGLKRLQEDHSEATGRLEEMEEDFREGRQRTEALRGQLASANSQLGEIREAVERADALWDQLEQEIKTHQDRLRILEEAPHEAEDAALEAAIHDGEAKVQEAQGALDQRREVRMEAARLRDAAWAERDALQRQVQLQQRGVFDVEAELKRVESDLSESDGKRVEAGSHIQELEAEAQEKLKERQLAGDALAGLQPRLEAEAETLRVQERAAREFQEALENARQLHHENQVAAAQVQGGVDALTKEVELALGLEVPAFMASITEEERAAWELGELVHQTRLNEAQSSRLDLGGVNPLAIQELAEAEERMAFMQQQQGDVNEAIGNLESTIAEINATSEERFREAFEFINARFSEVFRETFGGGSAHLSLDEPKDLLECGIEITAQPPGKSAKALTLLSGGEKALTAISLLFAIFHYKPSPFCVLDEVDAPLDEANVGRFVGLVQKMKADTQFVVITHQKPTMVAADTLYGVTMQEKGISKLVSVQLREAEQLV
ncbi:MAG: chromosome segregation protein SMC [Holophagaceae bacterium]|nr:chromosome segregation protein SMC [Holophagaceae bacterium]